MEIESFFNSIMNKFLPFPLHKISDLPLIVCCDFPSLIVNEYSNEISEILKPKSLKNGKSNFPLISSSFINLAIVLFIVNK